MEKLSFAQKRVKHLVESFEDMEPEHQGEVLDKIKYQGALRAAQEVAKTKTVSFGDLYEIAKHRQQFFNKFEGFGTGLKYFDDATMGFRPGEVTIIAGPSNYGKTMIALNIVTSAAEKCLKKVLIISTEMTKEEIGTRLYNIADDHDTVKDLIMVQTELSVSVDHIKAMVERDKPDLLMIDHLQFLANTESGSEYERINRAMAHVKRLAITANIPIILISHVSKARSGKSGEATASDLKGSSSIEQDSDIVLMINRLADQTAGDEIIITCVKHRTKRPRVFYENCIIKLKGIKVIDNGKYTVFSK
jgi:replicative DNA helicase